MPANHHSVLHQPDLFAAIAPYWWDPEGPVATLHHMNPLRLDWIQQWTALPGKIGLDVGCGGGILTESLVERGASVLGIDCATPLIQTAKRHAALKKLSGVQYQAMTAEEWAADPAHHAQYDFITCMELLEHVADPESLIAACAILLKPGGQIFFSTLNRTARSFFTTIVAGEYILGLLPKGTHQYKSYIKPHELVQVLLRQGLTPKATQGVAYNPWQKVASYCDGIQVNYLLVAIK